MQAVTAELKEERRLHRRLQAELRAPSTTYSPPPRAPQSEKKHSRAPFDTTFPLTPPRNLPTRPLVARSPARDIPTGKYLKKSE